MFFSMQSDSYIKNWNRIFRSKPLGALLPLPSEAEGVVVDYSEDFTVYSILPPKTRILQAVVDKHKELPSQKFELDTPLILLGVIYIPKGIQNLHIAPCLCLKCSSQDYIVRHQILRYSETNSSFYSYNLPNTWRSGAICLGEVSRTPKSTNRILWSSVFNNDFGRSSAETTEKFIHHIKTFHLQSCRKVYPFSKQIVATKNLKSSIDYAIFVSQSPKIVNKLPSELHRVSNIYGRSWGPYVFGLAYRSYNTWIVDFGKGYTRELHSKEFRIPT